MSKEKKIKKQRIFGLVGKNISYSFSKKYFTNKFNEFFFDNCEYFNFDIESIDKLPKIIKENPKVLGLNITIPYKEDIIKHLDKTSKKAKKIGAVNCVKITKKGKLIGYNTDWYGFKKSLEKLITENHKKALILGTGGASKAVAFALQKLNIEYDFVSRQPNEFQYSYHDLNEKIFSEYYIIINTTPLGTFPNTEECPNINYKLFTSKHIAYDLVYNPEVSLFLKKARKNGALIKNGYEMLVLQAEKGWKIWNK